MFVINNLESFQTNSSVQRINTRKKTNLHNLQILHVYKKVFLTPV